MHFQSADMAEVVLQRTDRSIRKLLRPVNNNCPPEILRSRNPLYERAILSFEKESWDELSTFRNLASSLGDCKGIWRLPCPCVLGREVAWAGALLCEKNRKWKPRGPRPWPWAPLRNMIRFETSRHKQTLGLWVSLAYYQQGKNSKTRYTRTW